MSLTQVIKEAQYKTQDELEKLYEEMPENEIEELFEINQVDGEWEKKKQNQNTINCLFVCLSILLKAARNLL